MYTDLIESFELREVGLPQNKGEAWYIFNPSQSPNRANEFRYIFPYAKRYKQEDKDNMRLAHFNLYDHSPYKGSWYFCNAGAIVTRLKKIFNEPVASIKAFGIAELSEILPAEIKVNGSKYCLEINPAFKDGDINYCSLYSKYKDKTDNPDIFACFIDKNLANALAMTYVYLKTESICIFNL